MGTGTLQERVNEDLSSICGAELKSTNARQHARVSIGTASAAELRVRAFLDAWSNQGVFGPERTPLSRLHETVDGMVPTRLLRSQDFSAISKLLRDTREKDAPAECEALAEAGVADLEPSAAVLDSPGSQAPGPQAGLTSGDHVRRTAAPLVLNSLYGDAGNRSVPGRVWEGSLESAEAFHRGNRFTRHHLE